jgi:hypothetical protein
MNTPRVFASARLNFRIQCQLADVRRPDFLFTLGNQHQVHRQLLSCAANGMQGGQQRRLRSLLVHRAAPHHHLANAGFVDDLGLQRRRAPLGRIKLLYVIHEVQANRVFRTDIERGKHSRFAFRLDDLDLLETRFASQLGHVVGAFLRVQVFRGDGGERNPVLQALDVVRMLLADLLFQGRPTGRSRTNRGTRKDEAAQQCTEGKTMTANFPGRSRLTHNLTPVG